MVVQMAGGAKKIGDHLGARSICQTLREQIEDGVFGDDGSLPSSRGLAHELGVSRTTVTAAYEQLQAEGFIEVKQGMRPKVIRMRTPSHERTLSKSVSPSRLSSYGRRLTEFAPSSAVLEGDVVADFRHGDLSGEDFPAIAWRRAMMEVMRNKPDRLSYADPRGSRRLRTALQGYLWRARTIRCSLDQIIVVNGSQQGLDLCARLLLDTGDGFVIENPCYDMARQVFQYTGAKPEPIDVDGQGMKTELLKGIAAKLAYVTPSHQFPLGGVMSLARRKELLEWASSSEAYIVEDDYDSEFRYDISPVPPLYGLEENDSVIYCGTVSKTLSPALRLGYLVVPPALSTVFASAKMLTDRHSPAPQQEALALLIENGGYEAHVRRIRRLNRERRETLLNALVRKFGSTIDIEGADAGLHLVVWLKQISLSDEASLIEMASKEGVRLYSIRSLYSEMATANSKTNVGLVLGYSSMEPRQIERGVHILANITQKLIAAVRGRR